MGQVRSVQAWLHWHIEATKEPLDHPWLHTISQLFVCVCVCVYVSTCVWKTVISVCADMPQICLYTVFMLCLTVCMYICPCMCKCPVCVRVCVCVCVKQTLHQCDYTAVADRQRTPFIQNSRLQFHLTRSLFKCVCSHVSVFVPEHLCVCVCVCVCVYLKQRITGDGEWWRE